MNQTIYSFAEFSAAILKRAMHEIRFLRDWGVYRIRRDWFRFRGLLLRNRLHGLRALAQEPLAKPSDKPSP